VVIADQQFWESNPYNRRLRHNIKFSLIERLANYNLLHGTTLLTGEVIQSPTKLEDNWSGM
jgi:hypothetical protein